MRYLVMLLLSFSIFSNVVLFENQGIMYDEMTNKPYTGKYINEEEGYIRTYVNGILEGYAESPYMYGSIAKGQYKNGKKEGLWKAMKMDGNYFSIIEYKNGEEILLFYVGTGHDDDKPVYFKYGKQLFTIYIHSKDSQKILDFVMDSNYFERVKVEYIDFEKELKTIENFIYRLVTVSFQNEKSEYRRKFYKRNPFTKEITSVAIYDEYTLISEEKY